MIKEYIYPGPLETLSHYATLVNVAIITLLAIFNYRVAKQKDETVKNNELEAIRQKVDLITNNHLIHIEHRLEKIEESVQDIWKFISTNKGS